MADSKSSDTDNKPEGEQYFFPEHNVSVIATSQEQALKKLETELKSTEAKE